MMTATDLILLMPDPLNTFLTVWLFFVGGCIGSFLNVVVLRLPAGMSISRTGSRCPICLHSIRWYDNIPLVSWANLRGKCRDCGTPISIRYPLVEFLVAAIFLILAFGEGFTGGDNLPDRILAPAYLRLSGFEIWSIYTYHLILLITLAGAALIERDRQRVPLSLYLPALIAGCVGAIALPHLHPVWPTLGAVGSERIAAISDMLIGLVVGAGLGLLAWPGTAKEPFGNKLPHHVPLSLRGLQGVRKNAVGYFRTAPNHVKWQLRWLWTRRPAGSHDRLLAIAPTALCGLFLGWQAASVVTAIASIALLLKTTLARVAPRTGRGPWQGYLTLLSILYIVNWRTIVEQFPELGPHGGLEVAGMAVLLVVSSSLFTRWIYQPPQLAQVDHTKDGDVMAPQDKDTEQNLKAILESPSYLPVELDVEFLTQPEVRPVRLQLELLKTEIGFSRENVTSTIVVFGGTQIVPSEEANSRLEKARQLLAESPHDSGCARAVRRSERVVAKSRYYAAAREFARLVSSECQIQGKCDYVITTGGGPGAMEAANRGAHDVGAKSCGLNIVLPKEQSPNPYITPDLCFQFHYFALRKMHFLMRAKALVVFPGGFGTLDELFDALTLRQTDRMQEIPIILFGKEYWNRVIDFQFLADEGVVADQDLQLVSYADTAADAWRIIRDFHTQKDM